jgi:hypothetical protein
MGHVGREISVVCVGKAVRLPRIYETALLLEICGVTQIRELAFFISSLQGPPHPTCHSSVGISDLPGST